ncbi:binding-protein-dependent transport systems inner membrane component [Caldicellulosiruptor hydrothermalis 108]|uniref:Binding-protein-dependent transport systems inner membrane component n=1 Tax=Caldicellulosiruptor hydrothermalis (strain DSM 18901 / VKM B-2411 / 108) TaxID=632292 RepID=E4Q925_CALH1|nr:ABC transporter permease [Caldicellulosiruptor hydrothermalis]ADQ08074.1 binding-protein-dependent transport systems inner membrane component [Caldicellulosiruptor hydrothermalis 108]
MRYVKELWEEIKVNRKAMTGFVILMFFILMATIGPRVLKLDLTIRFSERYQMPSWKHILGTDFAGRDTFVQLVYGSQEVLSVGILTATFTILIGFFIGALSGLIGKWVDSIIMFITNLFLTIPQFPILIVISTLIKVSNPLVFSLILSLFSWGGLARAIRSQILSLKHSEFIVACRIMNLSTMHIIFKEIMPNIISYIAVNFIFIIQSAVNASVGLMMLGLAPYSPTNWGMMISLAVQNTGGIFNPRAYIYLLSPIVCLALFQLGCIFLANGLDEAFNPRIKSQKGS